jgi:hypothetical protein
MEFRPLLQAGNTFVVVDISRCISMVWQDVADETANHPDHLSIS